MVVDLCDMSHAYIVPERRYGILELAVGKERTVSCIHLGLDAARFADHDRGVRVVLLHRGIGFGEEVPKPSSVSIDFCLVPLLIERVGIPSGAIRCASSLEHVW